MARQGGERREAFPRRNPGRQPDEHHEHRDQRQGHDQDQCRGEVDRHHVDHDRDRHHDPRQQRRQVPAERAVQCIDAVGESRGQGAGVLLTLPRRASGLAGDHGPAQPRLDLCRGALRQELREPGRTGAHDHRSDQEPEHGRVVHQARAVQERPRDDPAERGGLHDQSESGHQREQRTDGQQPRDRGIEAQEPWIDGRTGRLVPDPLLRDRGPELTGGRRRLRSGRDHVSGVDPPSLSSRASFRAACRRASRRSTTCNGVSEGASTESRLIRWRNTQ